MKATEFVHLRLYYLVFNPFEAFRVLYLASEWAR